MPSVLLEQPFVKDDKQTVGKMAEAGEHEDRSRFVRWEIGQGVSRRKPARMARKRRMAEGNIAYGIGRYRRVVLKISGEGFAHPGERGIGMDAVMHIARQTVQAAQHGVQIAIVIGGGNILRGAQFTAGNSCDPRGHGPLHGHAGHGDQRPGPARRPGIAGLRHAADDRHPHGRRGRAVHPPPRPPAPGKGPDRHPGRRHRQPLRHHRHGRGPAGAWSSRPTSC